MKYIIGIDLGTTNSAVAFVDTTKGHFPVELFSVPQLVGPGHIEARSTLPSFCYLSSPGEWTDGTNTFVGHWAKVQGAKVPTKLVQSAKSWLCNAAVERREKILPVDAADISQRMSPVEASAKYLMHLKNSWNETFAKDDASAIFEEQEIMLTVPASFDEVARTLTVEAARLAGLTQITLLEEPQAAFYSWIAQHESTWQEQFKEGQSILVCDVGGGTTDFSLIEIQSKDGKLTFQRMAVGDHLLLGGDNMDVALAHYLEAKLQHPLEGTQWLQLLAEARSAKEELLGSSQKKQYSISLQGTGSSVIKGSISTILEKEEVEKFLGEGFFGSYPLVEALKLKKSTGLRSMGLPYEEEPSVSKHLAHFLDQAGYFNSGKGIDYILFNGGTLKPALFQNSLLKSLVDWFPHRQPIVLPTASLDLAVARGAAYYGKVKRGKGIAIEGGLPRAYYLEVDVKAPNGELTRKALTLLPRGSQEGAEFHSDQIFSLRSNRPVAFHLLTSHVRLQDAAGEMISIQEEEMQKLPPITTILRFGRSQSGMDENQTIPVRLGIRLTAVGIIELWLASQNTDHKWNLEFQWRAASGQDHNLLAASAKEVKQDETFASGYLNEAKQTIASFYGRTLKANKLTDALEENLQQPKREWPPSILRGLADSLLQGASKRKSSLEVEARFWNLVGFLLRPGYGFPLDDFRIKELWKIILGDLKNPRNQEIQIAQWICFRRIAGGLNKGQQMQIASELMIDLFDKKSGKLDIKRNSDLYPYSEKIRALAALERIDLSLKVKLGDALALRIGQNEGESCDSWSLGRIGARHLMYGSVGQVVPRDTCVKWIEKIFLIEPKNREQHLFILSQLARKTDQREINLPDKIMEKIIAKFPELQKDLLEERNLSSQEQEEIFGDQLPPGLVLNLDE
jgi:molecular chaperone DnaK (HSP70)